MRLVQYEDEVRKERKRTRDAYGSVVTNFTALPEEYNNWIRERTLYKFQSGPTSFLIYHNKRGNEVFFFSDTYDSIILALDDIKKQLKNPTIVEVIQRDCVSRIGTPIMILQRMSSTEIPRYKEFATSEVLAASKEDLNMIEDILMSNFDPQAERVPTSDQLETIVDNPLRGGIYLCKDGEKITGLMIYSLDKTTIHLRYWWTDPSYRNKGIGSRLLNKFFQLGADCKRMILWVKTGNNEAIKRYEHYGFVPEKMFDLIYKIK